MIDNMIDITESTIEIKEETIIKVMGIGGGGCNAVNNMYSQGIMGVSFLVCNTDRQVLQKSSVPFRLQLGTGLGAGGNPQTACQYAEESREQIREALSDGTKMLFIIAGMGGGTGTGASPVVASVAKELGILTVAVVTLPFLFESVPQIKKALRGAAALSNNVDAILVINNEKLPEVYPDFSMNNAFLKSDDAMRNVVKSIAEIVTIEGYINIDFADVENTLKGGGIAIMGVGFSESGENRITQAIENVIKSPLINNADIHGAKRILLQFNSPPDEEHAMKISETKQVNQFIENLGWNVEVRWGITFDENVKDEIKVILIASGYDINELARITKNDNDTYLNFLLHKYYNIKDLPTKPIEDSIPFEEEKESEKTKSQQREQNTTGSQKENEIIIIDDSDDEEEEQPWIRK